jgi:hypothetical protein
MNTKRYFRFKILAGFLVDVKYFIRKHLKSVTVATIKGLRNSMFVNTWPSFNCSSANTWLAVPLTDELLLCRRKRRLLELLLESLEKLVFLLNTS